MRLTEFLLERIAEDEASVADLFAEWGEPSGGRIAAWQFQLVASHEYAHITTQPERILAECEAKRAVIALHPEAVKDSFKAGALWAYGEVLRRMALVYAYHPDYREEWRP